METDGGNYLFDTGQGYAIVQNSLALKKDLSSIESIMISHGHYDHTGGLPAVLKIKGAVDIFAHPDMFAERIWSNNGQTRSIGIPFQRSYLESLGARFRLHTEMMEVGPGIYLTGEVPRTSDFEKGDANMTLISEEGRQVHPDPLLDDLSMVVETDKGLIIVLGCAHAGVLNILDHVREKMGICRLRAILGGTHLMFYGPEDLPRVMDELERFSIGLIGVSHCTGFQAAVALCNRFGDRFTAASAGRVFGF